MAASPFAFFRGAAAVMAADLAATPISGLRVQACGDAHLSNFGVFAAPDRRLVFDLNDFDETLPGPWEWDVKRLAASFAIAGREQRLQAQGAARGGADRRRAPTARRCASFAAMRNLEVWYARLDVEDALQSSSRPSDPKAVKQVREGRRRRPAPRTACGRSTELTETVDGELRIAADPPLLVPIEELLPATTPRARRRDAVRRSSTPTATSLPGDRRHLLDGYRFRDIARKVVGVGSVGTRAWVVLLTGADDARPAVPAGEGGAGLGARALRRRAAASATTAGGWSRGSG